MQAETSHTSPLASTLSQNARSPNAWRRTWARRASLTWALVGITAVCVALWQGREHLWAEAQLPVMMPNLVLAWIPYLLAFILEGMLCTITGWDVVYPRGGALQKAMNRRPWWSLLGLGLAWLVFLPNAPYLVTDMAHWRPAKGMPSWCDLVYLYAFGWTGLALCYASVVGLQELVTRRWGTLAGWTFAIGTLALSTAGVYAGRFWRWNSWEVVTQPAMLAADLARLGDRGVAHRAVVFGAAFFALSLMSYGLLHTLGSAAARREPTPEATAP